MGSGIHQKDSKALYLFDILFQNLSAILFATPSGGGDPNMLYITTNIKSMPKRERVLQFIAVQQAKKNIKE